VSSSFILVVEPFESRHSKLNPSFHCMFTFGYEQRGSETAALLAVGSLANPKHALMVVQDTAKFARKVFVYTNGNSSLAEELRGVLMASSVNSEVDDRVIEQLAKGPERTQIVIKLKDGVEHIRDFMVHQPSTRPPLWIVEQLQLECDMMGNIKTNGFFHNTNVKGVYAAGDCASPFKIIPNALNMGANAGAGLARELPRSVTGNDVNMSV
jgi:gliotoxin/aspirochlorine biosynthesis thioredoxin reductase